MSPLESRAWLQIWAMGLPYAVYFTLQLTWPDGFDRLPLIPRLACFGAAALTHLAITAVGWIILKRRERGDVPLVDERDRAIENRATLTSYYALMAGIIVVGVVMPFRNQGWKIVNTSVFAIVLAEMLRHTLVALAYRRATRLAR
jgi:hypothetical protein